MRQRQGEEKSRSPASLGMTTCVADTIRRGFGEEANSRDCWGLVCGWRQDLQISWPPGAHRSPRIMRRVMDYFEHGLGEIALAHSLDCTVTEDTGPSWVSGEGTSRILAKCTSTPRERGLVPGPANPPTAFKFRHRDREPWWFLNTRVFRFCQ